MTYFSFATKNKDIVEEVIEKKKGGPFDIVFKIFSLINEKNASWNKELNILFKEYEEGDYGFISWVINHYLAYNKFLRENMELFFTTQAFLGNQKYIYFFVRYCITNKLKFPKFMQWYKCDISNDPKRFSDNLKEVSKLKEDDMKEFISIMSQRGFSLREINLNLQNLIE